MSNNQITLTVKNILIQVGNLSLSPTEIKDDDLLFSTKLRIDSIVIVNLIAVLEKEFDIDVNNSEVMDFDFETVGELTKIIKEMVERKNK